MAARILLTGASGYVGSRLLRVLEEDGRVVRCLARQPEGVTASRATTLPARCMKPFPQIELDQARGG